MGRTSVKVGDWIEDHNGERWLVSARRMIHGRDLVYALIHNTRPMRILLEEEVLKLASHRS